jgi:hypothetical protein
MIREKAPARVAIESFDNGVTESGKYSIGPVAASRCFVTRVTESGKYTIASFHEKSTFQPVSFETTHANLELPLPHLIIHLFTGDEIRNSVQWNVLPASQPGKFWRQEIFMRSE